jgi:hypothetical protein
LGKFVVSRSQNRDLVSPPFVIDAAHVERMVGNFIIDNNLMSDIV